MLGGACLRMVRAKSRTPARDGRAVPGVRCAEHLPEMGFLVKNHEEVKDEKQAGSIDEERAATAQPGNGQDDEKDAAVHGVARPAIEPRNDEGLWRVERYGCAEAANGEIPCTAKVYQDADTKEEIGRGR